MILVSNRLPMTVEKKLSGGFKITKSTGGLVTGLREIYRSEQCHWVGFSGVCADEPGYQELKQQLSQDRLVTVDLNQKEYNAFYSGASNNEIWPLFHYFPHAIESNPQNWPAYESVNQAFAKTILAIAKPGDQIWIHDYQLMFLPWLLRNAHLNLSIAYFHHIPFPAYELFRILKTRTEILSGLLGADLIGFHTTDYVNHFLNSVNRILGCTSHLDEVSYQGRKIKVIAHPLGVDVKMINEAIDKDIEEADVLHLAREIGNRTVLLGIDRLDYIKGIPERLLAFKRLLEQYPQHIGKITLIQICVPTRTNITRYSELRSLVEQLVGQINGEFGSPGYTPVQYLYRNFSQEELVAFYKLARVAVITPLRDGLNLVCKEYIAARNDDDGVVIISETAGAAAEMAEALIINPYDIDQFSQALHTALTMNAAERHDRLVKLRQRILESDNTVWAKSFIKFWQEAVNRNQHTHPQVLENGIHQLVRAIEQSSKCFLICNYELTADFIFGLQFPQNLEIILTTDGAKESCFKASNSSFSLIADNGASILVKDHSQWESLYLQEEFNNIKPEVNRLFSTYLSWVPGSYLEYKPFGVSLNYDKSEPLFAKARARDLTAAIAQLLENTLFRVYHKKNSIEIRPLLADKNHSLDTLLHRLQYQSENLLITISNSLIENELPELHPEHNIKINLTTTKEAKAFFQKISAKASKTMPGLST